MAVFFVFGIALGVFLLLAAIFNWDVWFYDAESQLINMIGGEGMVRWYWGVSGVVLVVASSTGWALGWQW